MNILIFTYISISLASNSGPLGVKEDFSVPRADFWQYDEGVLRCPTECFYSRYENLKFEHLQPHDMSALRLNLQSDCVGSHCCRGTLCTQYTSGQITSISEFTYGSYYVVLQTASGKTRGREFLSCFSLETQENNQDVFTKSQRIAICFPTSKRNQVILIIRAGDHLFRKELDIPTDSSWESSSYRIDWFPLRINLYYRGKMIFHTTYRDGTHIPRKPMRMRLSLLPAITDPSHLTPPNEEISLSMLVFFAGVILLEPHILDPHNDLMKLTDISATSFNFIKTTVYVIFGMTMLSVVLFLGYLDKHKHQPDGYEPLTD